MYDETGAGQRDYEFTAADISEKPSLSATYTPMYGPDGNAIRPGVPTETELKMPATYEEALTEVKYLWGRINALDASSNLNPEKRQQLRSDVNKIQTQWGITMTDIV